MNQINNSGTQFLVRKQSNLRQAIQRNHNRIKSALTDVTNITFNKNQTNKRRNAVIPFDVDSTPIIIQPIGEKLIQLYKSETNHLLKGIQQYQSIYREERINVFQEQQNHNNSNTQDYIKQHNSKEMIHLNGWMIVQFNKMKKSSIQTKFLGLKIMEQFLRQTQSFQDEDLALIGGCSIYLASKMVDIYPVYVEDVYMYICKEAYTIHELLQMEQLICKKLNYNLILETDYDTFEFLYPSIKPYLEEYYDNQTIKKIYETAGEILLLCDSSNNTIVNSISAWLAALQEHKSNGKISQGILNSCNQFALNLNVLIQLASRILLQYKQRQALK